MKVAVEVWGADFARVESTCRTAETVGLDGFYYGESPHGLNLDCWTVLAALAHGTATIRLGPVITNLLPTYRSRALLVRQIATVATIADGRIDLRTGAGAASAVARDWWGPFGIDYPSYDERLAELASTLAAFPRLLEREPSSPVVPVTVAARGERAMRVAARADAWETSFCTPAEFAARNAAMDRLAGNRSVERSLEIDGFLAPTPAGVARLLERVRSERAGEDLDAVIDRALVGTAADVADQLQRLGAAGVDQVVVALHDPHDPGALTALGEAARVLDAPAEDRREAAQ